MEKNINILTHCFSYNLNNIETNRQLEFKELSIPNYYMHNKVSNSQDEMINIYLGFISQLEDEIAFIYDAEKYVKQYCISLAKKRKIRDSKLYMSSNNYYFSNDFNIYIKKSIDNMELKNIKLTESNFFYFTSEFDYYIKKIYRQYKKDRLRLNDYDLFFLSLLIQDEYVDNLPIIKDANELVQIYFANMYNKIINNILYLDVFIYNLKYMLFNREAFNTLHNIWSEEESRSNEPPSEDERTFMLFLYSFEFTFLSYLFFFYSGKFLFSTEVVGVDPILKEILLCFQEIFEIDLLSKYINYKNGSLADINDPLFRHLLYLYDYYSGIFKLQQVPVMHICSADIVLDEHGEFKVQSNKFTLNYLSKVINGICFLNRRVNLSLDNLNILSLDFFQREYRPFLNINKKLGKKIIIYTTTDFSSLVTDMRFYKLHKYNYLKNKINPIPE